MLTLAPRGRLAPNGPNGSNGLTMRAAGRTQRNPAVMWRLAIKAIWGQGVSGLHPVSPTIETLLVRAGLGASEQDLKPRPRH